MSLQSVQPGNPTLGYNFNNRAELDSFLKAHKLSIVPALTLDATKKANPERLLRLMCPSPQGLVVADLNDRSIKVLNSGYGDKEPVFKLTDMKAFDPKARLAQLVSEKKIANIQGNANVEEAQVILLPDHCHPDQDHDAYRGEIGNAVRNKSNIFLCEGIDSQRWEISLEEKQDYLPQGLEFTKDEVYGWDVSHFHRAGLEKAHNILSGINVQDITVLEEVMKSGDISSLLGNFDKIMKLASAVDTINTQQDSLDNSVDIRTENLINTILKKLKSANGSRIIVDGGAAHLLDPMLLKALGENNIKFCAIGASRTLKHSSLSEMAKSMQGYYK